MIHIMHNDMYRKNLFFYLNHSWGNRFVEIIDTYSTIYHKDITHDRYLNKKFTFLELEQVVIYSFSYFLN